MRKLILNSGQVLEVVEDETDEALPLSTLSYWQSAGIAPATASRQPGTRRVPRLYTVPDVNRVLLVVRLRRDGYSMPKVRAIVAAVERELPRYLRTKNPAAGTLVVDSSGWRAVIQKPGSPAMEPTGQYRLRLGSPFVRRTERAARRAMAGG